MTFINNNLDAVTATPAVEDNTQPELCYQCAKCSAGCPVADDMDMLPHQVMHLLAMGQVDEAMRTKTLWLCAGCYTCATRCPNAINITAVMDKVRENAVAQGVKCPLPDAAKFHDAFLNDMKRRGRIHEMRMMGEYNIKRGKPFDNLGLGLKMIFKGRVSPKPPKASKGFKKWLKRLCNK